MADGVRSSLATEGARRIVKYAAITCPVESAAPSREARIQQGEDEDNAVYGVFPTAS
jgi:hypothetical protein